MRNKRDMYIDNKNTYHKKNKSSNNRNRRRGHKSGRAVAIALTMAAILGFGTFYLSRVRLMVQDETSKAQEDLGSKAQTNIMADDIIDKAKTDGIPNDQAAIGITQSDTGQDNNTRNDTGNDYNTLQDNTKTDTGNDYNTDRVYTKTDTGDNNNTDRDDTKTDIGDNNNANRDNMINSTKEITDSVEGDTSEELKETFMPGYLDQRKPTQVKGIYVTGPRAGQDNYMKDLIKLVDTTELNTMVIDIKNDTGEITYKMDLPEVKELHAGVNYISDIKALIAKLKEKDIYLIARVVAFKDPILAKGSPDLCIKKKDGSTFYDKSGLCWVNPYKTEVWEYLVSVAREAALLGFDEIQFDYIRFSTDSGMKNVDFGAEAKEKSKMDVITEFTKYACEKLKPLGVYVSADVYGTIIDSKVDSEIVGQNYKEMAKYLDYICPMIYPSHYNDGAYGIKHPDLKPYDLISSALDRSQTALKELEGNKAVVRSWLQDFTATWLDNHKSYGSDEIRDQIQAVYDAGYDEWILWNGNNNYTKDALIKDK